MKNLYSFDFFHSLKTFVYENTNKTIQFHTDFSIYTEIDKFVFFFFKLCFKYISLKNIFEQIK